MGRRLPAAYWASKSLDSMIGTRGRAQAVTAELLPVLGHFTGGGSQPKVWTAFTGTATWSTFVTDGNLGTDTILGSLAVLCRGVACSDLHYIKRDCMTDLHFSFPSCLMIVVNPAIWLDYPFSQHADSAQPRIPTLYIYQTLSPSWGWGLGTRLRLY